MGVFLFNVTIDDLEEGCEDLTDEANGVDCPDGLVMEPESEDDWEDEPPPPASCTNSTPLKLDGPTLDYLDSPVLPLGAKKKHKKTRRLDITDELRQEIPAEPNAITEARWISKLAALLRYIDDGFTLTRINYENSFGVIINGEMHRIKHAVQAQNVFRHLVREAERIGMVVNSAKTSMLCVSDSHAYKADAYILDSDQARVGCQETIKALGMHFSSRPDMWAQVNAIKKKFQMRYWMLRNLKKSRFNEEELVTVYTTMI